MFSVYDHLGQFSFRIPSAALVSRADEYLVRAYTYVPVMPKTIFDRVTYQWIQLRQYDKNYPDSNYVGAYFDELCAKGRTLGPLIKSGNTVRNSPVIVRMFRNDEGAWVVQQECRK
jgi:hypothetical protein